MCTPGYSIKFGHFSFKVFFFFTEIARSLKVASSQGPTQHMREILQVWPGLFPNFLGGA